MGFFSTGLKNEFEIAVVNEPPAFEPLKFYCSQKNNDGSNYEISDNRASSVTM